MAGNFPVPDDGLPMPRHTARGIVVRGNCILLMERWRPGLHYFSIPGGGIEAGETPQECAVREIAEETTVVVTAGREVLQMHDGDIVHHIYICSYVSGEPELPSTAPEAAYVEAKNLFKPGWIAIEDLDSLSLGYWQPVRESLIEGLKRDFPDQVTIVMADKAA